MGATAGYSIGRLLGIDPAFMAALGFVAVFAGASNTPLACTIMAVELFGGGSLLYVGVACFVAYLASGHRGIYGTQRIATPKTATGVLPDESVEAFAKRREGKE
jgi:H+/Cl- antiporter ClcA